MYSTCLFCQQALGANESIEHFPVGRRLAFDAAKGRLWVVCRKCERWNLTPLEERWEAIEECERAFRATKLRVSTDQIGLARLKEGTELVRIGEPQRPEMAAWRYGDQFGRRRRRNIAMMAGGVVIAGGVIVGGPVLGVVGIGFSPLFNLLNAGSSLYRARAMVRVPTPEGVARVRLANLARTRLFVDGDGLALDIATVNENQEFFSVGGRRDRHVTLRGDAAVRAAGALLPRMNAAGGSVADVKRAVEYLEETSDPGVLFHHAAGVIQHREDNKLFLRSGNLLKNLPQPARLALEMVAHEDAERRALEGELFLLEAAWKEAEEIAGIADDMFLPASVDEEFERLKRGKSQP